MEITLNEAIDILKQTKMRIVSEDLDQAYEDILDSRLQRWGGYDDFHDCGLNLDTFGEVCKNKGMDAVKAARYISKACRHGLKDLPDCYTDVGDWDEDYDKNSLGKNEKILDLLQTASVRDQNTLKEIYTILTGKKIKGLTRGEKEAAVGEEILSYGRELAAKYGISEDKFKEIFGSNPGFVRIHGELFGTRSFDDFDPEVAKANLPKIISRLDEICQRVEYVHNAINAGGTGLVSYADVDRGFVVSLVANLNGHNVKTSGMSDEEFLKYYLDQLRKEEPYNFEK